MSVPDTSSDVRNDFQQLVLERGRVLQDGKILDIDNLLNHRVHVPIMKRVGQWLATRFRDHKPDLVLTAESSGIAPGMVTAAALNVDLVYARKQRKITMRDKPVYTEHAVSPTKGGMVDFFVAQEVLLAGQRILIIDDFLASGLTLRALVRLVQDADATPIGIGTVVEKSFQGGRAFLTRHYPQVPVISLVKIEMMTMTGTILFK
jgi:xanthine phosphoribosyltransferase